MLMRVLVICLCGVAFFSACKPSTHSKLVGSWQAKTLNDAGEIQVRSDHTFTSREVAITYSHQPPVLSDAGEWHVHSSTLVLDFRGDTHPPEARHVEFSLVMRDDDHFAMRQANGL